MTSERLQCIGSELRAGWHERRFSILQNIKLKAFSEACLLKLDLIDRFFLECDAFSGFLVILARFT